MNKEDLKKYVLENPSLVSMKPAGDGLFVLKYKKKVFFDNLWNDYLEECRGTIVDEDFNIVQYPFTKIYNYGVEAKSPVLDPSTPVTAYRKVNGFMAAVTWYNDDILISTTGSTDSDYVQYIRNMIGDDMFRYRELLEQTNYTWLFECCHPSDPHIVPEEAGMYLLGARRKEYGSDIDTAQWSDWMEASARILRCKVPESYRVTVGELIEMSKKVQHEGFVFYTDDGISSKIKSPYYLVNKFVARCGNTDKLMRRDIKKNIDEEYYDLVDAIQADIETFSVMNEQERLAWCRKVLTKE